MCLLGCLCACKHLGFRFVRVCGFLQHNGSHLTDRHQNRLCVSSHFLKGACHVSTKPVPPFENKKCPLKQLHLSACCCYQHLRRLFFGPKNDKNDTTFFCKHVRTTWTRNNVCVCHSFYSVTAQLQLRGRRQTSFNSNWEAVGARRGGREQPQGCFSFLHSHVTCPPCTLCCSRLSLSSSVAGDMLNAESTPSAHTAKYDAREVSDSFINDELNKHSKLWAKGNKQRHQQQIRVASVLTLRCYRC